MKKSIKKILLSTLCIVSLFATSLTAFADWGGGSSNSGGVGGRPTGKGTYSYYGVKFSLARRSEMLSTGQVNRNNYEGYIRGGSGIVFLKNGYGLKTNYNTHNDIKSSAKEVIVNKNQLWYVPNANMTTYEVANVLGVDARKLDDMGRRLITNGDLSGRMDKNLHAHVQTNVLADYDNKTFSDVINPNGMLYNAEQRSKFYDRFVQALKQRGLSTGITKSEFMTNAGVLVVTPVVGLRDGHYISFPSANKVQDTGLNAKFRQIFYSTQGGYSLERQVPYGSLNGNVALTELGTLYQAHDINNKAISSRPGSWENVKNNKNKGVNWRYGFNVFGYMFKGESKSSSNLTVRATQNDDGSYTMDAKASLISQQSGNMPVDTSLVKGTTTNNGIKGGQSNNGGNIPTLVTNVDSGYQGNYRTYAYGSFLLKGSGSIGGNLDTMRKHMEGKSNAVVTPVNKGNYNAGNTYTPAYKHRTPQDTASYFASTNLKGSVSQRLVQNMVGVGNAEIRNIAYNLTAMANNKSKVSSASVNASNGLTAGTGDVRINGSDQNFGMAVEYVYKPKPVKSYISFAKVSYTQDLNSKVTVEKNSYKDHTLVDEAIFNIDKNHYFVALVPNSDTQNGLDKDSTGTNFWNKVSAGIKNGEVLDIEAFDKIVDSYHTSNSIVAEGTVNGATVAVGGNKGKGYSIYVLEVDAPEKLVIETDVDLQDYQLNKISLDILESRKGLLLNSGESIFKNGSGSKACSLGKGNHAVYSEDTLYNLGTNKLQDGTTIRQHKGSSKEKLVYNNSLLGESFTFNKINSGVANLSTKEPKRYTYAFNLSRGINGDKRELSALSSNQILSKDKDVLVNTHKLGYGVKPSNPKKAPLERNSYAKFMDEVKDVFVFDSSWVNGGRAPKGVEVLTHKDIINTPDGKKEASCNYQVQVASGSRPLKYNGLSIYELDVKLRETIFKYSTSKMATGVNAMAGKPVHVKNGEPSESDATGSPDNKVPSKYKYKYSLVASSDAEPLKFYPEVRMRAYFTGGTETISTSSITPKTVLTMAEELRQVKPSTMFGTTVTNRKDAVNGSNTKLSSDTMASGSLAGDASTSDKNLPVIYAGSDVTLSIPDTDYQINMFGYALDLVNESKDKGGFKVSDLTVIPYNSVVNDTKFNPYKEWGNKDSTSKLYEEYKDWTKLVSDNIGIDISLRVTDKSTEKKFYNNFNVSQGKPKVLGEVSENGVYNKEVFDKNTASKEEYVYPIYVRRGGIEKDTSNSMSRGYTELIKQIAKDYNVSKNDAEDIFEKSSMYQSILKAVEDIKDNENKSQNVNLDEKGVHAVRKEDANDNWYDEEVKTFVIRRYATKPINIGDIVLADKIDYNSAPKSSAGERNGTRNEYDNAQQKSYNTHKAQWFMTVYLKDSIKSVDIGEGKKKDTIYKDLDFFKPANMQKVNRGSKYFKDGTVLIDSVYVGKKGDFIIPSASTSDMVK